MKIHHYALILFILCAGLISAENEISMETFVFGHSYHSNRALDWHEENPGLAVGFSQHYGNHFDVLAVGGGYKDSYNQWARFALVGPRMILGDRNGYHSTLAVCAGYFEGSGFTGRGALPIASLGYNWLDLCFTGTPRNPNDAPKVATAIVAVFVDVRLATF